MPQRMECAAGAAVIGMIGAVKAQKNYVRALQILKALHEHKDAYLVILGGPVNTRGRPDRVGVGGQRGASPGIAKSRRDAGLRP